MIFVTVGTQKFQFNRLLKRIDDLIESGDITEDVFAQIGNSDYVPKNYKYTTFLSKEEFDDMVGRSSMLITHSGVGAIISALIRHKPVIVCPRLSKYGEHVDSHQLEIAEYFSSVGYVLVWNDKDSLADVVKDSKTFKFEEYKSKKAKAICIIRKYLKDLQEDI